MSTYTPMINQYLSIKEKHNDSILFFRMGDFYEMFFDDAKTASKTLEITLTARDGGKGRKVPMCGIPHHSSENYISKLIKNGFKVAVCEQVEDPKATKGIVKREVTRYITPGTVLSDNMLESNKNNYLAACFRDKDKIGLSFIDLSTGEFKVTEFDKEEIFINEFSRVSPSEVIIPSSFCIPDQLKRLIESREILVNDFDEWMCSYDNCYKEITNLFRVVSLDGFGLRNTTIGIIAAGMVILYLRQIHGRSLKHVSSLSPYSTKEYMILDSATTSNLEILRTIAGDDKVGTLNSVIDKTVTSMGGRLLRKWLLQPLCSVNAINKRLDAVTLLIEHETKMFGIIDILKQVADIERIISRIDSKLANPRDLVGLADSIKNSIELKYLLEDIGSDIFIKLKDMIGDFSCVTKLISDSIVNEPPISLKDGGFIKPGVNQALDELRSIKRDGRSWLTTLQDDERKRTGISTLKVKYNRVFGYYIEITKTHLDKVPENYMRKQTLVNCERYITSELKEKEALILGADERISKMELDLFNELVVKIMEYTKKLQKMAYGISILDVYCCFAQIALENNYTRPLVDNSDDLIIENGRHPVVEDLLKDEKFISNDTELSITKNQVAIITGPNMAGKSTYIRQVALITLMAQIGSFVPADKCKLGAVDRIFTRVGAADELVRGQSTFMLEMNETSNILHNATNRSLIILDEVGRGTSTFDGVSIAWAICEHIHDEIGARTLFATHYHELTELEIMKDRIKNYSVACREWNDEIIFLRKIIEGGTDKSYGIHVARLAGIPKKVIERAKEILVNLENEVIDEQGKPRFALDKDNKNQPLQLNLFENKKDKFIDDLNKIDINNLTPVEAMNELLELKNKYK